MKFIIKRSEWLRGEGPEGSRLYRKEDGCRCCLGGFGLALGLTDEQMVNIATPQGKYEKDRTPEGDPIYADMAVIPSTFPDWLVYRRRNCAIVTSTGMALMSINDAKFVIEDKENSQYNVYTHAVGEDDHRPWAPMTDELREKLLIERFAKNGVEVEFVD